MSNKPQVPHTMDDFSAGRSVAGFSQTRTGMWIAVSVVIHIVVISGTSVGFIRDTWYDPEGAKVRKAKAIEAAAALKAAATQPSAATKPSATTKPTASGKTPGSTGDPEMDAHKDAPVVKRSTDTAAPSEIPATPGDLDLSLDQTNKPGKK
ncbi:MAG: hypothetical protein NTW19_19135 [Planctomycetota bacterium]|nr:hypothetical protein [Planctomycetota bacterium]